MFLSDGNRAGLTGGSAAKGRVEASFQGCFCLLVTFWPPEIRFVVRPSTALEEHKRFNHGLYLLKLVSFLPWKVTANSG